MLLEKRPVRAKDFSQSAEDGPRMSPSMYARPGHRVHEPECTQDEQMGRSRKRIERTANKSGDLFQISAKLRCRILPVGSGNWTQGNTSPYGEM